MVEITRAVARGNAEKGEEGYGRAKEEKKGKDSKVYACQK